jgi:hypothetical protein
LVLPSRRVGERIDHDLGEALRVGRYPQVWLQVRIDSHVPVELVREHRLSVRHGRRDVACFECEVVKFQSVGCQTDKIGDDASVTSG